MQIIQETHLTINLTPPFQRDWRPSPSRKELSNARSGWFCQRDKSPIAMVSDLAHLALRRRKSRHGQSCTAKFSERGCVGTGNCKAIGDSSIVFTIPKLRGSFLRRKRSLERQARTKEGQTSWHPVERPSLELAAFWRKNGALKTPLAQSTLNGCDHPDGLR
jgi:hypothetical protein